MARRKKAAKKPKKRPPNKTKQRQPNKKKNTTTNNVTSILTIINEAESNNLTEDADDLVGSKYTPLKTSIKKEHSSGLITNEEEGFFNKTLTSKAPTDTATFNYAFTNNSIENEEDPKNSVTINEPLNWNSINGYLNENTTTEAHRQLIDTPTINATMIIKEIEEYSSGSTTEYADEPNSNGTEQNPNRNPIVQDELSSKCSYQKDLTVRDESSLNEPCTNTEFKNVWSTNLNFKTVTSVNGSKRISFGNSAIFGGLSVTRTNMHPEASKSTDKTPGTPISANSASVDSFGSDISTTSLIDSDVSSEIRSGTNLPPVTKISPYASSTDSTGVNLPSLTRISPAVSPMDSFGTDRPCVTTISPDVLLMDSLGTNLPSVTTISPDISSMDSTTKEALYETSTSSNASSSNLPGKYIPPINSIFTDTSSVNVRCCVPCTIPRGDSSLTNKTRRYVSPIDSFCSDVPTINLIDREVSNTSIATDLSFLTEISPGPSPMDSTAKKPPANSTSSNSSYRNPDPIKSIFTDTPSVSIKCCIPCISSSEDSSSVNKPSSSISSMDAKGTKIPCASPMSMSTVTSLEKSVKLSSRSKPKGKKPVVQDFPNTKLPISRYMPYMSQQVWRNVPHEHPVPKNPSKNTTIFTYVPSMHTSVFTYNPIHATVFTYMPTEYQTTPSTQADLYNPSPPSEVHSSNSQLDSPLSPSTRTSEDVKEPAPIPLNPIKDQLSVPCFIVPARVRDTLDRRLPCFGARIKKDQNKEPDISLNYENAVVDLSGLTATVQNKKRKNDLNPAKLAPGCIKQLLERPKELHIVSSGTTDEPLSPSFIKEVKQNKEHKNPLNFKETKMAVQYKHETALDLSEAVTGSSDTGNKEQTPMRPIANPSEFSCIVNSTSMAIPVKAVPETSYLRAALEGKKLGDSLFSSKTMIAGSPWLTTLKHPENHLISKKAITEQSFSGDNLKPNQINPFISPKGTVESASCTTATLKSVKKQGSLSSKGAPIFSSSRSTEEQNVELEDLLRSESGVSGPACSKEVLEIYKELVKLLSPNDSTIRLVSKDTAKQNHDLLSSNNSVIDFKTSASPKILEYFVSPREVIGISPRSGHIKPYDELAKLLTPETERSLSRDTFDTCQELEKLLSPVKPTVRPTCKTKSNENKRKRPLISKKIASSVHSRTAIKKTALESREDEAKPIAEVSSRIFESKKEAKNFADPKKAVAASFCCKWPLKHNKVHQRILKPKEDIGFSSMLEFEPNKLKCPHTEKAIMGSFKGAPKPEKELNRSLNIGRAVKGTSICTPNRQVKSPLGSKAKFVENSSSALHHDKHLFNTIYPGEANTSLSKQTVELKSQHKNPLHANEPISGFSRRALRHEKELSLSTSKTINSKRTILSNRELKRYLRTEEAIARLPFSTATLDHKQNLHNTLIPSESVSDISRQLFEPNKQLKIPLCSEKPIAEASRWTIEHGMEVGRILNRGHLVACTKTTAVANRQLKRPLCRKEAIIVPSSFTRTLEYNRDVQNRLNRNEAVNTPGQSFELNKELKEPARLEAVPGSTIDQNEELQRTLNTSETVVDFSKRTVEPHRLLKSKLTLNDPMATYSRWNLEQNGEQQRIFTPKNEVISASICTLEHKTERSLIPSEAISDPFKQILEPNSKNPFCMENGNEEPCSSRSTLNHNEELQTILCPGQAISASTRPTINPIKALNSILSLDEPMASCSRWILEHNKERQKLLNHKKGVASSSSSMEGTQSYSERFFSAEEIIPDTSSRETCKEFMNILNPEKSEVSCSNDNLEPYKELERLLCPGPVTGSSYSKEQNKEPEKLLLSREPVTGFSCPTKTFQPMEEEFINVSSADQDSRPSFSDATLEQNESNVQQTKIKKVIRRVVRRVAVKDESAAITASNSAQIELLREQVSVLTDVVRILIAENGAKDKGKRKKRRKQDQE